MWQHLVRDGVDAGKRTPSDGIVGKDSLKRASPDVALAPFVPNPNEEESLLNVELQAKGRKLVSALRIRLLSRLRHVDLHVASGPLTRSQHHPIVGP
jgi:hypothetical protein